MLKKAKRDKIHFEEGHPSKNILQLSVMFLIATLCYHINYRYQIMTLIVD